MTFMQWQKQAEIGVDLIDNDHKAIVKMINALFRGIKNGAGEQAVGKILHALVPLAVQHFKLEEYLFTQIDYPDAEAHRAEHALMTQQYVALEQKYKEGKVTDLDIEVLTLLVDVLKKHILGADQKYAPYFRTAYPGNDIVRPAAG